MLGVPVEDYQQLKAWSQDFAEMLATSSTIRIGRHEFSRVFWSMADYFRSAMREQRLNPP